MVCNDVKYCLEKDADSYYSRTGSEPFNLKPPSPDARKKMLTRQFHCQSVTVAREYFRVCPFFYSPSRFPLPPQTSQTPPNIIIFWHEFSCAILRVTFIAKGESLTSQKIDDDFSKIKKRNIAGSQLIKFRQITLCEFSFTFYLINVLIKFPVFLRSNLRDLFKGFRYMVFPYITYLTYCNIYIQLIN